MEDKIKLGIPVIAYCGGIFYLSSLSTVPETLTILPDKIGHAILYAGLGFLVALYLSYNRRLKTGLLLGLTGAFCLVYGIFDEFHQHLVNGRFAEVGDVIADLFGGLLGGVLTAAAIRTNLLPAPNRKQ